MEMSHQGGAEAESLLRPGQKNAVVMSHGNRSIGWGEQEGEKAPFLRNEPVKLTPAWEGNNLPNDTLNFKGMAMDLGPPRDKFNLVYIILLIHGLGTLIAWNMFITAKSYFAYYKLADAKEYSNNYLAYVGWAAQVPSCLFNWINIFAPMGGDLTTRIVWSLVAEVAIFVFTIILAMVDSTAWPATFFWLTMVSVLLLNSFNAIFQNSVFGVAARLPSKYTGAVVLGSNVCGTIVTFMSWLFEFLDNSRTSAIYFFITGIFVLLICFDLYFALPLNRFFRYHETLQQRTLQVNPALAATNQHDTAAKAKVPYGAIFAQTWVQLYNVFMVFFVTLAIFPSVHTDIKPLDPNFVLGKHFVNIGCFLTFNLMAMIGNITANTWQFPSRRWLSILTTSRLVFIPLFLFCNYKPGERTLPVLVTSDWAYWAAGALLGWSSGHASSLGMMYVSGNVAPEHAPTAGMLGAAILVTGILAGLLFTRLCPILVTLDYSFMGI